MQKKFLYSFMLMGIIMIGCSDNKTETPTVLETFSPCNIEIGGVKFTQSKNNAESGVTIINDTLKFVAGPQTDYFHAPDEQSTINSSPVLFAEVDNTKPFTFTAKIEPQFTATGTYSAGVLYAYENKTHSQKLCFEQDEYGDHRVVTVRTIGTSDDNNHQSIAGPFVYMRISSDGKQIGSYFSEDGEVWRMTRLYKNDYPDRLLLGISSQSPKDKEHTCYFSEVTLSDKAVSDFRNGKLE